jgi:hypothetical protein
MADFGEVSNETGFGYYKPPANSTKKIVEGWYPSHIITATVNPPRMIRGKYKAKIYHFRVEIAAAHGYTVTDADRVESSTSEYAGRELYHNGVFFFLFPREEDTFQENSEGNKLYAEFLRAIDVPLEKVEVDGVYKYYLPEIDPVTALGKPVLVYARKSKPFVGRQGDRIAPMQIKYVRKWSGGEPVKIKGLKLPI